MNILPYLLKKIPNVKLLLVGEGPDRSKIETIIREKELFDYVLMTGNVMNVEDYLNAMDVFVFPSLYEGMPLAMVEGSL